MGKRIRYPKKQKKEKEQKQEQKKEEQKTHFVLDVHDSTVSGTTSFGQ